jgi:hypothetical protein
MQLIGKNNLCRVSIKKNVVLLKTKINKITFSPSKGGVAPHSNTPPLPLGESKGE